MSRSAATPKGSRWSSFTAAGWRHSSPTIGATSIRRAYRIVLFDQRGCGRSRPHASLEENTTWDLVSDMEVIREHLGIDRWVVFGGSWGSTLSLAYAQTPPSGSRPSSFAASFSCATPRFAGSTREGASNIYPDAWESYLEPIPPEERGDLVQAYYKRLTSDDPGERSRAARAWSVWEGSTSRLIPDDDLAEKFSTDEFADAFARIECHYFINKGFFKSPNHLLENVDAIRDIPAVIVQGRYDVVCPMRSAWDLHRAWPEAEFHVITDAGHASSEPGIVDRLIQATDRFRDTP